MGAATSKYHLQAPPCGQADAGEIAENDFNLAARCYKAQGVEKPPQ